MQSLQGLELQQDFEQILLGRARVLALPLEAASSPGEDMLRFAVGEELFAIPISALREVVMTAMVTAVPGVPPPFVGLANVRGALMPVLDPRSLLGVRGPRPAGIHPILVVATEGGALGLWADRVDGLIRVELDELHWGHSEGVACVGGRTSDLTGVIDLNEFVQAARGAAIPDTPELEA